MKIQPILPVVGVVVLGSLLVMLLQRSPEPQTAAPTSRTSTPVSPPQPAVLHQAGQEQGEAAPVVDAATGQSLGAESPAKPAIVVRTDVRPQPNREVSIGLVLAGPDGQNLPITSVVHSQQPPGLRIISEAGQVVAQGNFAYG